LFFFRGRGVFFDRSDGKFRRHPCTAPPEHYDALGNRGRPHLRAPKSWYDKNGWTTMLRRDIEQLDAGTIISVETTGIARPTMLWTGDRTRIHARRPIYFKFLDADRRTALVDYIDAGLTLAIQRVFQCGPMTALELVAGR
jgi:hypothetical protein